MLLRIVLGLFLVLPSPAWAAKLRPHSVPTQTHLFVMGDTHWGETDVGWPTRAGVDTLLAWGLRQKPKPSAVVILGDWTEGDSTIWTGAHAFRDTIRVSIQAKGSVVLPVVGNHESNDYGGGPDGVIEVPNPNPFSGATAPWQHLFHGRSYYDYTLNQVHLFAMNDIVDTLTNYLDCNPVTDYAGFSDTTSAQWTYFRSILNARKKNDWYIPLIHRSPYAPYNNSSASRPLYGACRTNGLKVFEDRNLDMVFSGDVHVMGFSRPIKAATKTAGGVHYLVVKGRYVGRKVSFARCPASWWIYPTADSSEVIMRSAAGYFLDFYGGVCRVRMVKADGWTTAVTVVDTLILRSP